MSNRAFFAPASTPIEALGFDSEGVPVSLTEDGARRWDELHGIIAPSFRVAQEGER